MKTLKKILVVDDEQDLRNLLTERLMAAGYNVSTAINGKEGLEKATAEKPDLIILDVMLPDTDGFKLCGLIKSNKEMKNIPIIMLTCLGQIEDIKAAIEKGASAYIAKPFDPKVLLSRIRALIG